MRLQEMTEVYSAANVVPNSTNPYLLVFIIPTKYIGSGNGCLSLECVVIFPRRIKTKKVWKTEVFTCVLLD